MVDGDRLRQILSAVQAGVILVDERGAITFCNPATERILGMSAEQIRDWPVADPRWRTVGEDGRPIPAEGRPAMVAVRTGRPVRGITIGLGPEGGELTWLRADAEPLRDPSGRVVGAVATFTDVTDQERRGAAIAAGQRALRMLAGIGEAVLRARSEGELFASACRVAVEAGGFRMAWAGVATPASGGFLVPVAWHGHEDGYLQRVKVTAAVQDAWGAGPGGQSLRSGRVTVVNDTASDPRTAQWREDMLARGYRSGAAMPLVDGETRLGILAVYAGEPDAFGPEVVEVLQRLADDLAFGIGVLRVRSAAERTTAELALATELMGLEVHRLDLRTGRISYSERARAARGLEPGGDGVPLEELWKRFPPEDLGWAREQFAVACSAPPGSPDYRPPQPMRFLLPDGTVRSFDFRSRVLFDAAGKAESVITAAIEVTDRVREQERLRALTARLQEIREEEKARIARDLHDELGQVLTALQLELRGAEAAAEELGPEAGALVDRLVAASTLGDATLREVQRIAHGLRSEALEAVGLDAALRQELRAFRHRTGLEVVESLLPVEGLDRRVATTLFRIGQEALTNVARHARARRVEVGLSASHDRVVLAVADDGCGLPGGEPGPRRLGLLGMRERAAELGGNVTVASTPRGGTCVTATLPLPRRPPP